MSFIVKGIDLPKDGELHLVISKNGIICSAEYLAKVKHAYPLNLNAQAIQIPKDHGRISDVGGVRKELNTMLVEGETFVTAVEFAKLTIDAAPTILEAEE